MKHLWNILDSLKKTSNLFWFLDYDGTLTPIAPEPKQAVLDPEMKRLLESLAEKLSRDKKRQEGSGAEEDGLGEKNILCRQPWP